MIAHSSFPKIGQFRQVIKDVREQSSYAGNNNEGVPMYHPNVVYPIIEFTGTVKLHGTNAGVAYNHKDGMWIQSRSNIITPTKDNAGFAFFIETRRELFKSMLCDLYSHRDVNYGDTIVIFGEWAGGNIQKGVALNGLNKSFFIFDIKIIPEIGTPSFYISPIGLGFPEFNIYNVYDYKTFKCSIDFNNPEDIQNELIKITEDVEKQCPVSLALGSDGIGEGIVWSADWSGQKLRFKVKGEKHSTSNIKVLASVNTDKINSVKDFVDYAVTENRFNQCLSVIFPSNEGVSIKKLGDVIKWMINDIISEESDTLSNNGLEPKDVNKYISVKTRELFFKKL